MLMDIFDKAGVVIYPLLICSVVSLTVILDRLLFWFLQHRRVDQNLVDEVLELARAGKYEEIRSRTQGVGDYVIKV